MVLNISGEVASWATTNLISSANLTLAPANLKSVDPMATSDLFKVRIGYYAQLCAGDSGSGFMGGCHGTYSQNSSFHCLYGVVSSAKNGVDGNSCSDTVEVTDIYIHRDFINKYMEDYDDYCHKE